MPMTSSPRSSRASHRCDPMKPAHPVTTYVLTDLRGTVGTPTLSSGATLMVMKRFLRAVVGALAQPTLRVSPPLVTWPKKQIDLDQRRDCRTDAGPPGPSAGSTGARPQPESSKVRTGCSGAGFGDGLVAGGGAGLGAGAGRGAGACVCVGGGGGLRGG